MFSIWEVCSWIFKELFFKKTGFTYINKIKEHQMLIKKGMLCTEVHD